MLKSDITKQETPAAKFGLIDLAMFMVALIWATGNIITKIAFSEINPEAFIPLRFIIASALFLVYLIPKGFDSQIRLCDWGWFLLLGLVGTTILQPLYLKGLSLTTASNTSLIMATAPAIVALLNRRLYGESFKTWGWIGIGVAFCGEFLIIQNGQGFGFSGSTLSGDLMELIGAGFWALYTVLVTPLVKRFSPTYITGISTILGTLPLILLEWHGLQSQDWGRVTIVGWGGLFFSAAIGYVVAYLVWNMSVKKIGGARTAIYQNLSPVLTVIGGVCILGESITFPMVIGAAMILGGVYLVRLSK